MEHSPDDILHLQGALQVDTAIEALNTLDVHAEGANKLNFIRTLQKELTAIFPDEPERITIHFEGGQTAAIKAGIIMGLELMSTDAQTPEQKIAALALLEVMTQ